MPYDEPTITLNSTTLSASQAMTLRVALSAFACQMNEDGLGADAHGVSMTARYLGDIANIMKIMGIQPEMQK